MDFETSYLYCSKKLIDPLQEVQEIYSVVKAVSWVPGKITALKGNGKEVAWQEAYNRLFEIEFEKIDGWELHPLLSKKPRHKGDVLKNDVFVEIQFGHTATIYRDYYKFHYGFMNRLLTLAVLIVPTNPLKFFPERNPASFRNMASYKYALEHFSALSIPVPILIIGLLPRNIED